MHCIYEETLSHHVTSYHPASFDVNPSSSGVLFYIYIPVSCSIISYCRIISAIDQIIREYWTILCSSHRKSLRTAGLCHRFERFWNWLNKRNPTELVSLEKGHVPKCEI
jgi:hypothetical protein